MATLGSLTLVCGALFTISPLAPAFSAEPAKTSVKPTVKDEAPKKTPVVPIAKPADKPAAKIIAVPADNTRLEAQIKFFETNIRPLFAEHCYRCHGEKSQESDLRLDTWAGIEKGGAAGPSVVAGKPDQSLLITAVKYTDNDLQMPPEKKLSEKQVKDLMAWIQMGLPHPDKGAGGANKKPVAKSKVTDASDLWSFRPLVSPPLPAVKNEAWVSNPIDRFILANLESKGMTPSKPADRRTLIRRATYDLTGLPPTVEDVEAFVNDKSPKAFERVLDRLLASPQYGERWGRHWLDVARYADSNGLDENVAFGTAHKYRDYVIAAFNKDKPYDQFIREQVAGDLLPAATTAIRHEQLKATGFLVLGPKVLAEVDKVKMEMDIIDEQIDTLSRAVMGLTVGCARCHDHKFDPISHVDYHALAGIFKSTKTMDSFATIGRWHENPIETDAEKAVREAHQKKLDAAKASLKTFTDVANAALIKANKPGFKLPAKDVEKLYPAKEQAEFKKLKDDVDALTKAMPQIPTVLGVEEGKIANVPIHIRGSHLTLGEVVPRGFLKTVQWQSPPVIDAKASGRLALATWLTDPKHPLTSRVMVNRIWRWHFGRGLSRSPDNFGRLGDFPDHPALLDWLASQFIRDGWSMKTMHRRIMLSSTYQMSTDFQASAAAVDPDNLQLWRMNHHRLEAEEIRDSLLAIAGQLDRKMGGSQLHVKNYEFLFDHTSKDGTTYTSRQRSVYLPVIRNNLYEIFQLFDFADSTVMTGNRTSSMVSTQALFWMNSDLLLNAADSLSDQLLSAKQYSDSERVRRLYLTLFARPATDAEMARALRFLAEVESAPDVQQRLAKARSDAAPKVSAAAKGVVKPPNAAVGEKVPAMAGNKSVADAGSGTKGSPTSGDKTNGGNAAAAGPSDAELRRQEAWGALCRVLLATNEFMFVE